MEKDLRKLLPLALLLLLCWLGTAKSANGFDSELASMAEQRTDSRKNSWPELVGTEGEQAQSAVKQEDSTLNVQLVPEDAFVTMDWREDRVRIFVNKEGKVAKVPSRG